MQDMEDRATVGRDMDTDMKDEGANTPDTLTEQAQRVIDGLRFENTPESIRDAQIVERLRARLAEAERLLAEGANEIDNLADLLEAEHAHLAEAQAALEGLRALVLELASHFTEDHMPGDLYDRVQAALASSGADSVKEQRTFDDSDCTGSSWLA